ncbi:hypothetical protein ACQP1P_40970 [Dactylosporangium sp. CA-052675]|uniref:hypothetical protein n=1 Tax=Dactylosporangium sp. CA-052675 TaxID=3239927 RepID=UPI003D922A21
MEFDHLSQDSTDRLHALAEAVRSTLRLAGLVVGDTATAEIVHSGVELEIDTGDDAGAGIYLSWCVSAELSDRVGPAFREGRFDDPGVQLFGAANELAQEFLIRLLRRVGFNAREAHDLAPFSVHIPLGDGGIGQKVDPDMG